MKVLLSTIVVLVGVVAILSGAYTVHGSLEIYPTEEQQDKVRVVMGSVFVASILVEVALVFFLRRVLSSSRGQTAA
jgi:heme/copper-type cytochrome/quinol oxidase subunit 2